MSIKNIKNGQNLFINYKFNINFNGLGLIALVKFRLSL